MLRSQVIGSERSWQGSHSLESWNCYLSHCSASRKLNQKWCLTQSRDPQQCISWQCWHLSRNMDHVFTFGSSFHLWIKFSVNMSRNMDQVFPFVAPRGAEYVQFVPKSNTLLAISDQIWEFTISERIWERIWDRKPHLGDSHQQRWAMSLLFKNMNSDYNKQYDFRPVK